MIHEVTSDYIKDTSIYQFGDARITSDVFPKYLIPHLKKYLEDKPTETPAKNGIIYAKNADSAASTLAPYIWLADDICCRVVSDASFNRSESFDYADCDVLILLGVSRRGDEKDGLILDTIVSRIVNKAGVTILQGADRKVIFDLVNLAKKMAGV